MTARALALPGGLLLIAIAWATVITPGCLPGTQPAPPPPAPTTTDQPWVVEASGYNRPSDTHYVVCIPASHASRDYTRRDQWRDVIVTPDIAYAAEPGDPCPPGPIRP